MKGIAAIVLVAACGTRGKPAAPVGQRYTIFVNLLKQPAGGVPISVAFPPDWKVETDPMGSPAFRPAGFDGPIGAPGVMAIFCPDATDADACVEQGVKIDFGDQPITRKPDGPGRLWVTTASAKSTHERLFVADVADHVLVMCQGVFVDDDKKFLPDFEKACATLRVRP